MTQLTPQPIYDTPILGMKTRPRVDQPTEFGNAASFWVEYPNGLVDLSRATHLDADAKNAKVPPLLDSQLDIPTDGNRTIRIDKKKTAVVVIDMQKCVRCSRAARMDS